MSRRPAATLLAAVIALPMVVCAPASATPRGSVATARTASTATDVLRLDFDYLTGPDGTPVTEIRTSGSARVTADVAQRNGGQVLAATARPDRGRAVSLPGFDPDAESPRAVIRIRNAAGKDKLSPGPRDFTFGADVVLDAESSLPGSSDDGDNLVQRGLYDDPQQYKLQIDDRRPSCRLKGKISGESVVEEVIAKDPIDAVHWYGVDCVREGTALSIVVKRFNDDGSSTTATRTVHSSAPLRITMRSATVPLSVGGKLGADGEVMVDSDQFNGIVDNVHVQVG